MIIDQAWERLRRLTAPDFTFGVERTSALLDSLGRPQDAYKVIHVAGTNGKGTTVALMRAMFSAAGHITGAYTSPELIDYRERITVANTPVDREYVDSWVTRNEAILRRIGASFFEATTALAAEYFRDRGVKVAIFETGLGGRLDSTNALTSEVAAVTSIGLDHTEFLGDSLSQIADEKAAIYKRGAAAIVGEWEPDLRKQLRERAVRVGSGPVIITADEYVVDETVEHEHGTTFAVRRNGVRIRGSLSLFGLHQLKNAFTATEAFLASEMSEGASATDAFQSIATTQVPGRFQRVGRFLFDVAHNEDGVRALASLLQRVPIPRPLTAVVSILANKRWDEMLSVIAPAVDKLVLVTAPSSPASRRWDPTLAMSRVASRGVDVQATDWDSALSLAESTAGTVLFTGSFHTVGDAMLRLHVSPFAG